MATKSDANALFRQDFRSFVVKAFHTLHPGRELQPNWHIDAMAFQLERVRARATHQLMINVPPRSLKSIIVSVAWPAFLLGHNPALQIMVVSHGYDLATELQNMFRKVVESDWYKSAFATMRAAPIKDTERQFKTTKGGARLAVSVEGSVTGQGADMIILDDPLDASDADSEVACAKVNEWIDKVLATRQNNPAEGVMVVVMQRLSVFDPAAHLMENGQWEKLILPARADCDQVIPTGDGYVHEFRKGDLLDPERLREEYLTKQASQMGKAAYLAQYQQQPVPGGGGVVDTSLFQRYTDLPKPYDIRFISIDAASGSDSGSYSVMQSFQVTDGRLYMTGSHRGRWPFPELRKRVIALQAQEQANFIAIENASSGRALLEELWQHYPREIRRPLLQTINPRCAKDIRMDRALVSVEAGRVFLPEQAGWLSALLTELQAFPHGVNDDQADALSQAVEFYERLLRSRYNPAFRNSGRAFSF